MEFCGNPVEISNYQGIVIWAFTMLTWIEAIINDHIVILSTMHYSSLKQIVIMKYVTVTIIA